MQFEICLWNSVEGDLKMAQLWLREVVQVVLCFCCFGLHHVLTI